MVRPAVRQEFPSFRDPSDAEEEALMAETAEAVKTLRARLAAAQERAAAADQRRQLIAAEQTQTIQSRCDEVRTLEQTVAQLKERAREYNKALNEAATLVDEMDRRILQFQRQIAAAHGMLAAACPDGPATAKTGVRITEESLAQDLDLIRKRDGRQEVVALRNQLDRILAV